VTVGRWIGADWLPAASVAVITKSLAAFATSGTMME